MRTKVFRGTVLLVTNHEPFKSSMQRALIQEGYGIRIVRNQEEGIEEIRHSMPTIVLVDRRESGFSLLYHALACLVPIVTTTYHTTPCDERHCIMDLEDGAVRAACNASPSILVALLGAVLRRQRWERPAPKHYIADGVTIDLENYEVKVEAAPIHTSRTEFRILQSLLVAPGHYLSRGALLSQVWGEGFFVSPHTLDVHISSLRRKLDSRGTCPDFIKTIKGLGFKLRTTLCPEEVQSVEPDHSTTLAVPSDSSAFRYSPRQAAFLTVGSSRWRHSSTGSPSARSRSKSRSQGRPLKGRREAAFV